MIKKTLTVVFLVLFLSFPVFAFANVDDDIWVYSFLLQYKQGILAPQEGVEIPYDLIPTAFEEEVPATKGEYYGIILTVKGKEDARFGFNKPTVQNVSSGKSLLAVRAPYFANADHVSFYSRDGKHLFDISVRGSSFCNDNNSCDTQTGENYLNCPNDCPPPPPLPTTPIPSPTVPTGSTGGETTTTPSLGPDPTPEPITDTVVKTPGSLPSLTISPVTIAVLVVSIIVLLILFAVWKVRKNMD